jgi:hypothetical protein
MPTPRIIDVPVSTKDTGTGKWRTTEVIHENGRVRVQMVTPKGTPRTLTVTP